MPTVYGSPLNVLQTIFFQEHLLQSSGPGPLDSEGVNVEDVLNIISQSIYREGEGTHFDTHILML